MPRKPKGTLAKAISAALALPDTHPLFYDARSIVRDALVEGGSDQRARELLGEVAPATWIRWKRRIGLEIKVTNPGRQNAEL